MKAIILLLFFLTNNYSLSTPHTNLFIVEGMYINKQKMYLLSIAEVSQTPDPGFTE